MPLWNNQRQIVQEHSKTYLQTLQHWLASSSNESVSSNEPSMTSLLLPIPDELLPDESRSSDSNILISLMVSGSTVVSMRLGNVVSVAVGTDDGATLLNISADAIIHQPNTVSLSFNTQSQRWNPISKIKGVLSRECV